MYHNQNDSIKNILNSSSSSINSLLGNKVNQFHTPLQLLLSVDFSKNQDGFIINNLLKFFNISLNESTDETTLAHLPQEDINAAKKVIEYLNFIRFKHDSPSSPVRQNIQTESSISNNNNNSNKITIPSYSIILLSNNAFMNKTTKQIMDSDDALRIVYEQSKINNHHLLRSNINWSYNHKIELNDEYGKTMARQLYFKLNFNNNSNEEDSIFPLCCRTMWVSPKSSYSQNSACKYIVRLNINCKNYDLMLFFYRLLFDKCPNYSKKDFSLFVLQPTNQNKINIEFQLSLKNDQNVNVNHLKNATLVYNIPNRTTFDNVTRLLDGFSEEVIKNKVYAVQDPDHNKIYLIDSSNSSQTINYFSSVGLAEKYFSINNTLMYQKHQQPTTTALLTSLKNSNSNGNSSVIPQEKNLSYSPNSNTSSSSESHSFDSGRWSCSAVSSSSVSPPNSNRNELKLLKTPKQQQVETLKISENTIFDLNKNKVNNDTSSTNSCSSRSEEANSVKDLIKKFNCTNIMNNNVVNVQNVCRSSSNRAPIANQQQQQQQQHLIQNNLQSASSRLVNNLNDETDDYDLELEQLLKRATNNSMHAFNEMTLFKNNKSINPSTAPTPKISIPNRVSRHMSKTPSYLNNPLYHRSQSVLNEPIKNNNSYQTAKNLNNAMNINNHLIKSALLNGTSDLFNRKKSKSVTFMDSIGTSSNENEIKNQSSSDLVNKIQQNSFYSNSLADNKKPSINKYKRNNLAIERERSKSTLPFMCSSSNRYIDNTQYSQMLNNNINYPCFNNNEYDYHGGEDDDSSDDEESSSVADIVNGSDCLLVADVDDDDTYVKISAANLNRQKEQYKLILEQQQESLHKKQHHSNNNVNSLFEFNRNCLIDNQKVIESQQEYQKKPNVGITAKTRFRRSHTLDLLRSTRMPLKIDDNMFNINNKQSSNNNICTSSSNTTRYLKNENNYNNFIQNKNINKNGLNSNSYMIKIEQQKPPIKV